MHGSAMTMTHRKSQSMLRALCLLVVVSYASAITLPIITPLARPVSLRPRWHNAVAAARSSRTVKEAKPLEPGVVALMLSGTYLALGLGLQCVPRVLAGIITGFMVTPPVQILDIAIMENASGKRTFPVALQHGVDKLIHDPLKFVRSQETALVYILFSATYASANLCKALKTPTMVTLLVTTMTNMVACFYKDSELARICGLGPRHAFPAWGYANLAARDVLSMGSTFTLPPVLSTVLKAGGLPQGVASNLAQFFCPIAAQTVQVPFHLMALSFYNYPNMTRKKRIQTIQEQYKVTLLARMMRVLPCYGAGGVLNTNLQTGLIAVMK